MIEERIETFLLKNFTGGDIVNEEHLTRNYSLKYIQELEKNGYIIKIKNKNQIKYMITTKGKQERDRKQV